MASRVRTPLLIVGAGPFGLALAAHATALGIEHVIVGEPMGFWRHHMPAGMLLRSDTDWHLDAAGIHTFEAFIAEQGLEPEALRPLALQTYLDYGEWFRQQKRIEPIDDFIERLDVGPDGRFAAYGRESTYDAKAVVLAIGFANFKNVPADLAAVLPSGRTDHTCDAVDLAAMRGQRVLIIGGRQSAFEWAALLAEAGAAAVHLSYRHETPRFEQSEWEWVPPLVDRIASDPAWYRGLTDADKAELNRRLWFEGRQRLEPWLAARIARPEVHLWPGSHVAASHEVNGSLAVSLENVGTIEVDRVVLATGYRVDLGRVPFLADGNLSSLIEQRNGFPALSDDFESSVPGLYFTSMAATQEFGSFFGFTVSARASARVIGDAVRKKLG